MLEEFSIKKIAEMKNGFVDKFGIPRQSGLASSVKSQIVFEPEYRVAEAFKGLEGFSHIWIIWQFSRSAQDNWSPTVRPPRLGGNKRVGVFSTRSPFRPNSLGLSCVKLENIEYTKDLGPVLTVSGADLLNGTPIFDIKPYIAYADSKPDALDGFLKDSPRIKLDVIVSCDSEIDAQILENIKEIVSEDPRPAYQNEPERVYKMDYFDYNIEFKVNGQKAEIIKILKEKK